MDILRSINEFWPLITAFGCLLAIAALAVLSGRFVTKDTYTKDAASLASIAASLDVNDTKLAERVDNIERRQNKLDTALREIAVRLDTMPTEASLREMLKAQHKTNERLATIAGRMEGITHNVELLMQDYRGQRNG